jgi:hypothetical protein
VTRVTGIAQRGVALLACAAVFAACEVSVEQSVQADSAAERRKLRCPPEPWVAMVRSVHPGALGSGGSGAMAGSSGRGGSFGAQGSAGLSGSAGDSGDASQGSGGIAGSASGGTAGVGGSAGSTSGGTAGVGGSAGSTSGGTAGVGGSAGDSGVPDGSDGGPCLPGCPASAPVCSTGTCRKIKQIAPGGLHSCALIDDGTVRCWGQNNELQLGDSSRGPRLTPGRPSAG